MKYHVLFGLIATITPLLLFNQLYLSFFQFIDLIPTKNSNHPINQCIDLALSKEHLVSSFVNAKLSKETVSRYLTSNNEGEEWIENSDIPLNPENEDVENNGENGEEACEKIMIEELKAYLSTIEEEREKREREIKLIRNNEEKQNKYWLAMSQLDEIRSSIEVIIQQEQSKECIQRSQYLFMDDRKRINNLVTMYEQTIEEAQNSIGV